MTAGAKTMPVFWLVFALLVAGCAGPRISDLNGELIQLQQQKATLEREAPRRDETVIRLTQISEQFERVGDAGYAQARQAADLKAKISNYRIAATADWQRGNERALVVAQEGIQLCNTRNGFEVAPRDCAILLVIPSLMINDLMVLKVSQGGLNSAAPDFVTRAREATVVLLQSYLGLNSAISRVSTTGVSADMIQVMQTQQSRISTNIQKLVNMAQTAPDPENRPAAREICSLVRSQAPSITPARCPV